MKRNLFAAVCCATLAMSITMTSADAQSISIGSGGVQVRDAQGSVNVNSRGVRVYERGNTKRRYIRPRKTVQQAVPAQRVRIDRSGITVQQRIDAAPARLLVVTNTAAMNFQQEAELAMKHGDYAGASESVAEAIARDPSNARLHLFASHVYFAAGQYAKSSYELELATNTLPRNEWSFVHSNLDQVGGGSKYRAAHQSLVGHLSANPSDHDVRVLYAFHMWVQGDLRTAMKHNQYVLRSNPRHRLAARLHDAWTATTVRVDGGEDEVIVTDQYSDVRVDSTGSIVEIHSGPNSGIRVQESDRVGGASDAIRLDNGGIGVNPGQPDEVKIDNGGISVGNGLRIDF